MVYCPAFAVPFTVLVYTLGEQNFSLSAVWQDFRSPGWYARRVLTPLISNLGIWLPSVAIIYSLPSPLQLPLQNLVLIFFTLILAHLTRRRMEPKS